MTWPHSPWPLFCNDLNQARSWVKPQLQGAVSDRTGHLAISLGLGVELLMESDQGHYKQIPCQ